MQTRALARARRSVATIVRRSHDDEGVGEALLSWGLLAASGIAVFVTYARVPASQLYHVSGHGTAAGAGRALVFANFPAALAAIPVAAIAASRLNRRGATLAALFAIALSATVFWPGVVDQADLDGRWVNAAAALGTAVALGLTLLAGWRHGFGFQARRSGDDARLVVAVLLVFLSVPWIAADAGFHLDGVPVLSSIW